jgi:hypothetical protein
MREFSTRLGQRTGAAGHNRVQVRHEQWFRPAPATWLPHNGCAWISNLFMVGSAQSTVCQLMTLAPPRRIQPKMLNYVEFQESFFSHREQRACFEGNKSKRSLDPSFQKSSCEAASHLDLIRRG